ncbi:hypothetical protein [Dongshaea marina]|uniref:hypothetical protein n=1 Tax=Dongshaea marina TaxID=2047966 RepID=UPI00131F0A3F|nr:hypothetical protein [Dongshaea marina]
MKVTNRQISVNQQQNLKEKSAIARKRRNFEGMIGSVSIFIQPSRLEPNIPWPQKKRPSTLRCWGG